MGWSTWNRPMVVQGRGEATGQGGREPPAVRWAMGEGSPSTTSPRGTALLSGVEEAWCRVLSGLQPGEEVEEEGVEEEKEEMEKKEEEEEEKEEEEASLVDSAPAKEHTPRMVTSLPGSLTSGAKPCQDGL